MQRFIYANTYDIITLLIKLFLNSKLEDMSKEPIFRLGQSKYNFTT